MSFDVLFLSRFNAFCGVSTYTEQLATALLHKRVDVGALSSDFGARGESAPVPCVVGWSEDGGLVDLVDKIVELDPKIVHIQHEHGIFRNTRALIKVCENIRKKTSAKIVMTAHTVPRAVSGGYSDFLALIRSVDAVIVHSALCTNAIAGYNAKVCLPHVEVIPHGMLDPVDRIQRDISCKRTGLDSSDNIFRLLSIGFISKAKRHISMLGLLSFLIERRVLKGKKPELVVAGKQPETEKNTVGELRRAAVSLGIQKSVRIIEGFIAFEELPYYYGASDISIHMASSPQLSVSGSIRTDLSHGLPAIVMKSDMTSDIYSGIVSVGSSDEMYSRMGRIAENSVFLDALRNGAREFSLKNSWKIIATQHIKLYEKVSGTQLFDRRDGVRSALFHSSSWLLGGF